MNAAAALTLTKLKSWSFEMFVQFVDCSIMKHAAKGQRAVTLRLPQATDHIRGRLRQHYTSEGYQIVFVENESFTITW